MSYGFEIRDSSGNVTIDSSVTTFRILHKQFCTWDYSGSFTVSSFDSDVGAFYIKPQITVGAAPSTTVNCVLVSTGTNYDYDFKGTLTSTGGFHDAGYYLTFPDGNKPTLSWNNSTKSMTVTPAARPLSWDGIEWRNGGDYSIVFFEVA